MRDIRHSENRKISGCQTVSGNKVGVNPTGGPFSRPPDEAGNPETLVPRDCR